jgi:PAS domain S-box-containing protein
MERPREVLIGPGVASSLVGALDGREDVRCHPLGDRPADDATDDQTPPAGSYDCAVLDQRRRPGDALATLTALRSAGTALPAVVVVDPGENETIERVREYDRTDYFVHPDSAATEATKTTGATPETTESNDVSTATVAGLTNRIQQVASTNPTESPETGVGVNRTLDAIPDLYYLFDENLDFLDWNRRLTEETGYSDAEVADMHPADFFDEEDAETILDAISRIQEGEEVTVEATLVTKDDDRIPYEFTGARIDDGREGPITMAGIGRDVSRRKQSELRNHLLYETTRTVAEAESFESGLNAALEDLCDILGWSYAEVWTPSDDGAELEYLDSWHEDTDSMRAFADRSSDLSFESGFGIPGRVWESGSVQWVWEAADESRECVRKRAAEDVGFETGIGVPIEIDRQTVAVVLLFDTDSHSVRSNLRETMEALAANLQELFARKRMESALRERERQLSTLMANLPGLAYQARFDDNRSMTLVSEGCRDLTGYDSTRLQDGEVAWESDVVHPDDRAAVRETVESALADREDFEATYRIETADGDVSWVWEQGTGVYDDGDLAAVEGFIIDVTDRRQYETALTELHEATRTLVGTRSRTDVCDVIVETATEVLSPADAAVYLYDPDQNRLEPTAATESGRQRGDRPIPLDGGSAVAEAFVTSERRTVDADEEDIHPGEGDTAVERILAVPLADHGVFVLSAGPGRTFGDMERELVAILSNAAEEALGRVETETELTAHEAELQDQNRRLRELNRLNDLIRSVDRSLVKATTRSELERAVCERITDHESFAFAWVGAPEPLSETLTVRETGGDGRGYLDGRTVRTGGGAGDPAGRAMAREETVVVSSVGSGLGGEAWRRDALRRNLLSAVGIPLTYGQTVYGALTVYATDQGAFTDPVRQMLSELGETIGYAIDSFERKGTGGERAIEVEFVVRDESHRFAEMAAALGRSVTLRGIRRTSEDTAVGFLSWADDDVAETLAEIPGVDVVRVSGASSDHATARMEFDRSVPGRAIVDRGGVLKRVRADPAEVRLTVHLQKTRDVRELSERLSERYRDVELSARREGGQSAVERAPLQVPLDDLTERQSEVLRAAYYSGYFESPRETTGEELAEAFDVSSQAIHQHLRRAERRVFRALLDAESDVADRVE